MTTHYCNIDIATEKKDMPLMLGKLWQRLHGILAEKEITCVGISLPEMRNNYLGTYLRLHSDEKTLSEICGNYGIQDFQDMEAIKLNPIYLVPEDIKYPVIFRRERKKEKQMEAHILRSELRRFKYYIQQGRTISVEEVQNRLKKRKKVAQETQDKNEKNIIAYIRMLSYSTHKQFSLLIEKKKSPITQQGKFNYYGLSVDDSTVPYFDS